MGLIYEHWRLDTNECFYIGKAMGKEPYKRANNLSPRNPHHGHIVRNLKPLGLIEVRTGEFPGIKKAALNNLERLCIAHWRMYIGDRLTNQTDGGDGQSSEWAKEFFARPDMQEKKNAGIRKFDRSERGKKTRKLAGEKAGKTLKALHKTDAGKELARQSRERNIAAYEDPEFAARMKAAKNTDAAVANYSNAAHIRWGSKTKDERSAIGKKSAETGRRNRELNLKLGIAPPPNPMYTESGIAKQKENVPRGDTHYTKRPGFSSKSKKAVKNLDTGEMFASAKEAAQFYSMKSSWSIKVSCIQESKGITHRVGPNKHRFAYIVDLDLTEK